MINCVLKQSLNLFVASHSSRPSVRCCSHRKPSFPTFLLSGSSHHLIFNSRLSFTNPIAAEQRPIDIETATSRDSILTRLTDALILSFYACKAQSLFALSCFIKTNIALYKQNCTIIELQVCPSSFISFPTVSTSSTQILLSMKPFECGASILTDSEQDILLSWSVITMHTLHQIPLLSSGDMSLEDRMGKDATGMKGFVKQVLKMVESGVGLEELLETQEKANQETGVAPSARLMQLNSLIVTLTSEIVTQFRTGTNGDSYVASFLHTAKGNRDLSVKCLICFMGATLGSVFCIDRFIGSVMESFMKDLTAKQLIDAVAQEEYKQAWSLLPVLDTGVDRTGASITRQLFGRWVSIVFITLAESGLPHASATTSSGWAWAFEIQRDEDMFEMTNLTQFVQNALRRVRSEDTAQPLDLSERLSDVPDMLKHLSTYQKQAQEQKAQQYGSSLIAVEDEELGKTSSAALAFWQMIFLVHLTYRKLLVYQEEQE